MTNQHPITPPPELVEQWVRMLEYLPDKQVFSEVARWGADQELEACCEWIPKMTPWDVEQLRAARRPKPVAPTDEELLELMPQQFRDDLATVSRLAAHGASPDLPRGIFRVSLNTGALDYARAVLARWGQP